LWVLITADIGRAFVNLEYPYFVIYKSDINDTDTALFLNVVINKVRQIISG